LGPVGQYAVRACPFQVPFLLKVCGPPKIYAGGHKILTMGKLTGTQHGDAANDLMAFYLEKVTALEDAREFFMAAVALGFAVETSILTYLLVEFGDDNGGELEIPDSVNMSELIEAANQIDVLNAPIDIPSHAGDDEAPPKHIAKDVVDKIRRFRNLIHPARALKEGYDPRTFTREQLKEFKEMYSSITHSLLYYL
jgi:hypothetical protein